MTSQRLSININEQTQAELKHLMDRDGISVTEAVRRLIGYGAVVDRSIRDDGREVVIRGRLREHRLILLDGSEQ